MENILKIGAGVIVFFIIIIGANNYLNTNQNNSTFDKNYSEMSAKCSEASRNIDNENKVSFPEKDGYTTSVKSHFNSKDGVCYVDARVGKSNTFASVKILNGFENKILIECQKTTYPEPMNCDKGGKYAEPWFNRLYNTYFEN